MRKAVSRILLMLFVVCACVICIPNSVKAEDRIENLHQSYASDTIIEVQWTPSYNCGIIEWCEDKSFTGNTYHKQQFKLSVLYNYWTYKLENLKPGSTYYVRVTATDSDENIIEGSTSDTIPVATKPVGQVSAIKQLDAAKTSVILSWKACRGANYYRVYYAPNAHDLKNMKMLETSRTQIRIPELKEGTYGIAMIVPARKAGDFVAGNSWDLNFNPQNILFGYNFNNQGKGPKVVFCTTPKKENVDALNVLEFTSKKLVCEIQADTWGSVLKCPYAKGVDVQVKPYNSNKVVYSKSVKVPLGGLLEKYVVKGEGIDCFDYNIACKFKNVKAKSQFYKFRIRSYIICDGKKIAGAWSDYSYIAPSIKITKITRHKDKVTIKFEKVKGADRYIVYGGKYNAFCKKNTAKCELYRKYTHSFHVTAYMKKHSAGSGISAPGIKKKFKS